MSAEKPLKLAYSLYKSNDSANSSLSPIIFLHGLSGNKDHWDDVPQLVADQTKRMCYAVDARNHGDSEYTETYNFDADAVDLLHLLDTIHAEKAILVGFSIGGRTALLTTLTKPNRVEKIIIIDVSMKRISKELTDLVICYINSWITTVNQLSKDLPFEEAVTCALDSLYSNLPPNRLIAAKEQKKRYIGKTIYQTPDGTYGVKCNLHAVLEALRRDAFQKDWRGQFDGPVLFMAGELSPLCVDKEEANIRKHFFPNAEFVVFKGATHALMFEFPELFFQTVVKFLSQEKKE